MRLEKALIRPSSIIHFILKTTMEPNSDTATSNQSNNSAVSFKEKLAFGTGEFTNRYGENESMISPRQYII